jgi:hypothetical protein
MNSHRRLTALFGCSCSIRPRRWPQSKRLDFFRPIVLNLQLADSAVQLLLALGRGLRVMVGLLAEQLRQAIGNLFLPGGDLGRRGPATGGDHVNRFDALEGVQCHLGLELSGVVASFRHGRIGFLSSGPDPWGLTFGVPPTCAYFLQQPGELTFTASSPGSPASVPIVPTNSVALRPFLR